MRVWRIMVILAACSPLAACASVDDEGSTVALARTPKGSSIVVGGEKVRGLDLDPQSRCTHYHTPLDIVALRMRCCDRYYACHSCHEALADHPVQVWPANSLDEPAVLCGACGRELTIREYLECSSTCPRCSAAFNPGCRNHYHLYFEMPD